VLVFFDKDDIYEIYFWSFTKEKREKWIMS
jgi:hypothetical protein